MRTDVPRKAGHWRKEAPEERDAPWGLLCDQPARSGLVVLCSWVFVLPHLLYRSRRIWPEVLYEETALCAPRARY